MENLRGSLEKTPGRTGMHGSDPSDLDLTVQGETVRRSNLDHPSGIERPGRVSHAGRRRKPPEATSRGGAALGTRRTSVFQCSRAQIDRDLGLGWTTQHT